ncbi:hypothetical protein [Mastigocladopsis repens]|nr:hypothetical protein [Mastigocladopsis repens]
MKYVFHPEALSEYAEAVQYYAEQRNEVAQLENLQLDGASLMRIFGDV